MPGFDGDPIYGSVVYAENVDFSGNSLIGGTAQVTQNGQLLIGASSAPYIRVANLTSTGGTVAITNGPGTINLESVAEADTSYQTNSGTATPALGILKVLGSGGVTVSGSGNTVTVTLSGGSVAVDSFTPNSGTSPVVPNGSGLVVLQGTGSITTVGGLNSLTPQLTGLTNHAVLVGAGTATITKVGPTSTAGQIFQSAGASADPAFSTATYPSTATGTGTILRADGTNWVATTATYPTTTTVNQILYSSATNVIGGITAAIDGVLITDHAAGVPSILANGTVNYVLTANTAAPPSWQAVSASGAATAFDVQANTAPGTDPVLPLAGTITVNGGTAAAGSIPVRTNSLAANAYTVQVQISQALAATDATKIGLSNFSSGQFAVDVNGFVTLAGGTGPSIQTITGNTGGAESPSLGNFNVLGTGSITVAGSANTETVQLTGLTNHAIQIGAGTATLTQLGPTSTAGQVLQSAGAAADPAFSTATYPLTTTVNQILYSSATNVIGGITAAIDGVLITDHAAGVPSILANGTGGFVLTANTGAPPSWQANATLAWSVITANQTAAVNNGYICNKGSNLALALPATAVVGDVIRVTGMNTALGWTITQAANQQIFFGTTQTTLGATGSLSSAAIRDSLEIVCIVAGASSVYNCISSVGNITVV